MAVQTWFPSAKNGPETVTVRDDGQAAVEATETTPGVAERKAWPLGAGVKIKSHITGGDLEKIQTLQITPRFRAIASDVENAEMEAEFGVRLPTIAYCAVLIEGFVDAASKRGDTDFPTEEDDERIPDFCFHSVDTQKIMTVPRDLEERVELARDLPLPVSNFVYSEIAKRLANPLPGSRSVSDTSDASERQSTPPSRSSRRSK